MSWWKIIGSDDTIGDEPADAMQMTISAINQNRSDLELPALNIQEFMDSFNHALLKAIPELIQKPEIHFRELVITSDKNFMIYSNSESEAVDQAMVQKFLEGLKEIYDIYITNWERKPTLKEVIETLVFVIGGEQNLFINLPNDQVINSILFK